MALNSPWDLLLHGDSLFIAMAGTHQIYRFDLSPRVVDPWAESSVEALHDDERRKAALAQPSGLTTDGSRLFFADNESSAIRWADFGPNGQGTHDRGDRPFSISATAMADKVEWLDPATHATTSWLGGARNSGIRAASGSGRASLYCRHQPPQDCDRQARR